MPNSIDIGGIELRLVSFQEKERTWRGELVPSFSNRLMNGRDLPLRAWEGTTDAITPAEEIALRAVADSGNVVCTGLVLYGELVLCAVTVGAVPRGPDVQSGPTDYSAINVTVAITLQEA